MILSPCGYADHDDNDQWVYHGGRNWSISFTVQEAQKSWKAYFDFYIVSRFKFTLEDGFLSRQKNTISQQTD